MKHGFLKVGAFSLDIALADPKENSKRIIEKIKEAHDKGIKLLVLPELCITGASCKDLFRSDKLLSSSLNALSEICKATSELSILCVVGLPFACGGKLFNCAAIIFKGEVLGLVPKSAACGEEKRYFTSADELEGEVITIECLGKQVSFGQYQLFSCSSLPELRIGIEIGNDSSLPISPASLLCTSGATVICNPSAEVDLVGGWDYQRALIGLTSAKLICGYIHSGASYTESTQDNVCSGRALIAECGNIIAERKPFDDNEVISELDLKMLCSERYGKDDFSCASMPCYEFELAAEDCILTRKYDANPFIPDDCNIEERAELILNIQSHGLKRRLKHTGAGTAVIGISGGLDSTLALLVACRAFDLLKKDRSDIIAITMPCFGTSSRTKNNALSLCRELGINIREINIGDSVKQHFSDIGHDPEKTDITFENAQARERTQVLMDIANMSNGMVIGTGDLSELALGWATYNGDHMSMYGVNASIPKTLVRKVVEYEAKRLGGNLLTILTDIIDTPVSPELLPADKDGNIAQKTEDLVGPYELHDFFLYYTVRFGFSPEKIYRLARKAFAAQYSDETVLHWLKTFTRRFFNQQFKRSCLPDGPSVGSVSLSPRGAWSMPSDAYSRVWLDELDSIE